MKTSFKLLSVLAIGLSLTSCVAKKKLTELQARYEKSETDLV